MIVPRNVQKEGYCQRTGLSQDSSTFRYRKFESFVKVWTSMQSKIFDTSLNVCFGPCRCCFVWVLIGMNAFRHLKSYDVIHCTHDLLTGQWNIDGWHLSFSFKFRYLFLEHNLARIGWHAILIQIYRKQISAIIACVLMQVVQLEVLDMNDRNRFRF